MKNCLLLLIIGHSVCILPFAHSDDVLGLSSPPAPSVEEISGVVWSYPKFYFDQVTREMVITNAYTRQGVLFALKTNAASSTRVVADVLPQNNIRVTNIHVVDDKPFVCRLSTNYEEMPEYGIWELDPGNGLKSRGLLDWGKSNSVDVEIGADVTPPMVWSNGLNDAAYIVPQTCWRGFASNASGRITLKWERLIDRSPLSSSPYDKQKKELLVQCMRIGTITNGAPTGRWIAITRPFYGGELSNHIARVSEAWFDSKCNQKYYCEWSYDITGQVERVNYHDITSRIVMRWKYDRLVSLEVYSPGSDYPTMELVRQNYGVNTVDCFVSYAGYAAAFACTPEPIGDVRISRSRSSSNAWDWLLDWRKTGTAESVPTPKPRRADNP